MTPRCAKCNRAMKKPSPSGYGPVCARAMFGAKPERQRREAVKRDERSKRMHEQMTQATKLTRSRKLSEAQRAGRGKVSPDQVAAILNSEKGPYTTARELGVSGVVASRIKRGLAYKEYTAHPFAGLLSANDARRRA